MNWVDCKSKLVEVVREALEGYSGMADTIIQETSLVEDMAWFIHTEVADLEPDPKLVRGRTSFWSSLLLRWLYLYRNWREG